MVFAAPRGKLRPREVETVKQERGRPTPITTLLTMPSLITPLSPRAVGIRAPHGSPGTQLGKGEVGSPWGAPRFDLRRGESFMCQNFELREESPTIEASEAGEAVAHPTLDGSLPSEETADDGCHGWWRVVYPRGAKLRRGVELDSPLVRRVRASASSVEVLLIVTL